MKTRPKFNQRFALVALALALLGCTTSADQKSAAAYPEILALPELQALSQSRGLAEEETVKLAAEYAILLARAEALKGDVLTEQERQALLQAIAG